MISLFLASDHILHQLLRIFLPLSLPVDLLVDVILVEVRLLHYSLHDQLLQVLGKTEELLLVDRVHQRLRGRTDNRQFRLEVGVKVLGLLFLLLLVHMR
jgi:hypothetical protein